MHGYSEETEVLGKHFSITQVDTEQQAAEVTVKHLLQGKNVLSGEFSRRMKDGIYRLSHILRSPGCP